MATKATPSGIGEIDRHARGRARAGGESGFRRRSGAIQGRSASPSTISCSIFPSSASTPPFSRRWSSSPRRPAVEAKRDAMFARRENQRHRAARRPAHRVAQFLRRAGPGRRPRRHAGRSSARGKRCSHFAADVREGRVRGALGQPMTDVINIGIGGSDLGPAMATRALVAVRAAALRSHFVSNVDGADIADTLRGLDPARTLFIVSSKTFTTQETMTNAATARAWIAAGARRGGGRRPFRRRVDPARQGRANSASSRPGVRLLGLGRRPLFDLVEHRPAARHRDRARALRRIPARRLRGRRAFPRGADRAQHSDADGAAQRLEPQHPRPRHARR